MPQLVSINLGDCRGVIPSISSCYFPRLFSYTYASYHSSELIFHVKALRPEYFTALTRAALLVPRVSKLWWFNKCVSSQEWKIKWVSFQDFADAHSLTPPRLLSSSTPSPVLAACVSTPLAKVCNWWLVHMTVEQINSLCSIKSYPLWLARRPPMSQRGLVFSFEVASILSFLIYFWMKWKSEIIEKIHFLFSFWMISTFMYTYMFCHEYI